MLQTRLTPGRMVRRRLLRCSVSECVLRSYEDHSPSKVWLWRAARILVVCLAEPTQTRNSDRTPPDEGMRIGLVVSTLFCRKLNKRGLVFKIIHFSIIKCQPYSQEGYVEIQSVHDGETDADAPTTAICLCHPRLPTRAESLKSARH